MTMASAFSALDVREELRAQTLLDCNVGGYGEDFEPSLEEEEEEEEKVNVNMTEESNPKCSNGDVFTMRCLVGTGISKEEGAGAGEKGGIDIALKVNTPKDGIRQRKIEKNASKSKHSTIQ